MESNPAQSPLTEPQQRLVDLCHDEKFAEAEDLAGSIITEGVPCALAWTALSVILLQKGSLDASRNILKLPPKDAEANNNLGNILQMPGRLAKA